jgi:uncharacterized protein
MRQQNHAEDRDQRQDMLDLEEGEMSVREAGQKGGEAVKNKYGPQFYEEIGRKGGEARAAELGHEGMSDLGHRGGQKVKELIEEGKRAQRQEDTED